MNKEDPLALEIQIKQDQDEEQMTEEDKEK